MKQIGKEILEVNGTEKMCSLSVGEAEEMCSSADTDACGMCHIATKGEVVSL